MSTFADWDYFNKHVQSGLTEGQFLNSGGCMIAAGPPYLASIGATGDTVNTDTVWPIGLISQWGVSQNLAVIPIPEAGSYQRYIMTGPSDGGFQMSRSLYHGPSLLRAMYAYFSAPSEEDGATPILPLIPDDAAQGITRNPKLRITDPPGYENFWINLASEVFTQPVGIMLYFQDSNRESWGALYLEQFMTNAHSVSSGPGQIVIAEQTSGIFSRARPIKLVNSIPLMSRAVDAGTITVAGSQNTTGGPTRIPVPTGTNI